MLIIMLNVIFVADFHLNAQGAVVTTIGFLKEAPQINVHGFCVYHKNRLILVTILNYLR